MATGKALPNFFGEIRWLILGSFFLLFSSFGFSRIDPKDWTLEHSLTEFAQHDAQIECYPEQLVLRFPDPGNLHIIYLNGTEIWRGIDGSYTIGGLESNTPYTVFIKDAMDATQAIFYVHTLDNPAMATEKEAQIEVSEAETDFSKIDQEFYRSSLDIHVFADRIELKIGFIPNDTGVLEIYRNDEKIGEISEYLYIDYDVSEKTEYEYEVRGKRKVSDQELSLFKQQCIDNKIPITEKLIQELSYQEYSLSQCGVQTDAEVLITTAAATTAASQFLVRYATFIPWEKLWIPAYWSGHGHFKSVSGHTTWIPEDVYTNGNNRDFSPIAAKTNHKTLVDVLAKPGVSVTEAEPRVGKTEEWRTACRYKAKERALSTGMQLLNKTCKKDFSYWTYEHSVKNPLHLLSPPIYWYYNMTVYQNGRWRMVVRHSLSPYHEAYIVRKENELDVKKWQKIFRNKTSGNFNNFLSRLLQTDKKTREGGPPPR